MQTIYYIIIYYYNVKIFRKRNFCDPEPDHVNPKPSYAPFCRSATVAIYERLIQEAITGGGVGRERRGLIQAKAAEGSGRRQLRAVAPEGSGGGCYGPRLRKGAEGGSYGRWRRKGA